LAVGGRRVRHETVVAGECHRRIQEPIDDERAGILVELVLDRLAAERDFDDDVDVVRRVVADGYGLDTHGALLWLEGVYRAAPMA
jgi:hypothetical protein